MLKIVSNNKNIIIMNFELKTKEELFSLWKEASNAYYNADDPDDVIMSDSEFDELTDILRGFNDPYITSIIDSIQESNGEFMSGDDAIEASQMISLFKIKYKSIASIPEIRKFFRLDQNILDKLLYSPKLDGNAIKITKSDDLQHIERIQTRGGLDVTEKLINHHDIIKAFNDFPNEKYIQGELLCGKKIFLERFSEKYKNPRNFVSGVIKSELDKVGKTSMLTSDMIKLFSFVPYTNGISPINIIWKPVTQDFWGNIQQIYDFYKSDKFPFLCDGIVIGYKTDKQEVKDNYPLNLVAVKIKSSSVQTKIIDIEWSQKKSGKLTPVYKIDPVIIDGSEVSNANGYNYSMMKEDKCGIGAVVTIIKSGDIIPVIDKVIVPSTNYKLPECDFEVKGRHLFAIDREKSRLYKFVLGLKLLNIEGIGDTLANEIGEIVNYDIIELFNTIHKPDIREKLKGGKVWEKFELFYSNKKLYLDQVIEILQFDRVGKVLSKKFAMILTKQTRDVKGIENDVLRYVCKGDGFLKIQDSLKKLASFGVQVLKPFEINEATITYEMTGNPPQMTKNNFVDWMGSHYPNSIHVPLTKNTKYLICDDVKKNSSKTNKARKYNITLVSYADILMGKINLQ